MSYPWGTERRINAYSDYFRKQFGGRVQKVTIDAGFTCPNRDGTCGWGGCTFCDNKAFNPGYNKPEMPIGEQVRRGMEFHKKRYRKATGYLAYFQAYTNTYGNVDELRSRYEEALSVPGVVGLIVGTRPDCIYDEVLDCLEEFCTSHYVMVEYGIESVFNRTLERVNRGHDVETTEWAIRKTAARGIRVGGHMMVGLPGETMADFLQAATQVAQWPLNSIKYHQLQLIRGTAMAREYGMWPEDFMTFSLEEYLELMVRIVEVLNPGFILERIAGEVIPGTALLKGWGLRYDGVLARFEELLEEKDSWQGKNYKPDGLGTHS